jgi:hypothetical protein
MDIGTVADAAFIFAGRSVRRPILMLLGQATVNRMTLYNAIGAGDLNAATIRAVLEGIRR